MASARSLISAVSTGSPRAQNFLRRWEFSRVMSSLVKKRPHSHADRQPAYLSCAGFRAASLNFLVAASNPAVCKAKRLARTRGQFTGLAALRTIFEYPVSTWAHQAGRDAQ